MKLSSKMLDVGKNIVEGLWEGIKAKVEWLKEKVSGFLGGIVDSVKGVLGIQSPSKVFAGIGKYMGEGIGVGFEDAMADVEKDMQKAIPTDFDIDFPPIDVDFPSPKPGFGGGGTSRITLSPKVVIEKFVNNTAQDIDILAEKVGSKIASDINRRLAYCCLTALALTARTAQTWGFTYPQRMFFQTPLQMWCSLRLRAGWEIYLPTTSGVKTLSFHTMCLQIQET